MSYVIESNVPLPTKRGRPPCQERAVMVDLEVGQSFLIDDAERAHAARCVVRKLAPKRFTILKQRDGWRVWRLA